MQSGLKNPFTVDKILICQLKRAGVITTWLLNLNKHPPCEHTHIVKLKEAGGVYIAAELGDPHKLPFF